MSNQYISIIDTRTGDVIQTVLAITPEETAKVEAAGYQVTPRSHSSKVWDWVKGEVD